MATASRAAPAFTPADFDASGAPVWLPSAEGDTLTAQIALPSAEAVEALWFTVPSVAHRFASVGPRTSPVDPQAGEGEEEECTEPVDLLCAGKSLAYDTADAIGRITVEEAVGYTSQCTGTMLNTASAVQSRRVRIGTSAAARGVLPATLIYFLTANHCVSTHTEAASVEVLSFYRRTTCNGEYDRRQRAFLRGAELLASSSVQDSTLLRFKKRQDDLDELPFRLFLAGWTTEKMPDGASVFSVHHAGGRPAQYSEGRVLYTSEIGGVADFFVYNALMVDWSRGMIEGGASGAGLFLEEGLLVGVLSGSHGPCSDLSPNTTAGPFRDFFPQIHQWLDPASYEPEPVTHMLPALLGAGGQRARLRTHHERFRPLRRGSRSTRSTMRVSATDR